MPKMQKGDVQLACVIPGKLKATVALAAKARGEKLRKFVERALWNEYNRLPKRMRAMVEGLRGKVR